MTVFDASVVVDALLARGPAGDLARDRLRGERLLEAPAILSAEAVSAIRSLVIRGEVSASRANAALIALRDLRQIRHPFEPFLDRIWSLRNTLTVYDAWYVALAEWLDADLVTADAALAAAPGLQCRMVLVRAEA